MLNYLWGGMLLTGILYGGITGNMNEVTEAALSSAEEAVSLCITMAGIVAIASFFISADTGRTQIFRIYIR